MRPIGPAAICIALSLTGCAARKPTVGQAERDLVNKHYDWFEQDLQRGVSANARTTVTHESLVYIASAEGDLRALQILFKYGATVKHAESYDFTPLSAAAASGSIDCVDFLLRHGSKVNETNATGVTALFTAKDGAMVYALLKMGAKRDAKDQYGQTALFSLAGDAKPEAVEALLKAGANPNQGDGEGKTPLMIVVELAPAHEKVPISWSRKDGTRYLNEFPKVKETVAELIQAGANPAIRNSSGHNAYFFLNAGQSLRPLPDLTGSGDTGQDLASLATGEAESMLRPLPPEDRRELELIMLKIKSSPHLP